MDALKHLQEVNKDNQRAVLVNVGLIKSVLREIEGRAAVHGESVFTRMNITALKSAIGDVAANQPVRTE